MDFGNQTVEIREPPSQLMRSRPVADARQDTAQVRGNTGLDFCCVGAQKGGTGWLYEQLRSHPDFWMPPLKELHYFDRMWRSARGATVSRPLLLRTDDERIRLARKEAQDKRDIRFLDAIESLYARSDIDLEKYAELFAPKQSLLSGDITPGYALLQDEIIERIAQHFPNLKVIFIARDPVERAWSHLSMWVRHKSITPFDMTDPDEVTRNLLRPDVLMRSYPTKIVARWRRYVRPDLFQVYFFDDLRRDPAALRRSILEFLGADPKKASGELAADHNSKAKLEKLQLTDKVRSHVAHFFECELKACAAELGGPAAEWPGRYGF
jgi:Sulfotransferase family